jgi:LSD1 subclass zinc finger protein
MSVYHTIKIYCSGCRTLLYKYQKGGTGSLVKCFKDKILKDFTSGDMKCPNCHTHFARETMIRGKPAHKIIQGKIFVKK